MIYVIYDMTNIASIDFSQVREISQDTLRLSLDGTKTVLKFIGETPNFLTGLHQYTHEEILAIVNSSAWIQE
jgi:hypothetical protein